jgi:16S rRNA (guanine527-N7)-methyltransferase
LDEEPRAPTAVREPGSALDVHLADSLVALELDVLRGAGTIADVGAGAGFPGLPLAIALPRSHVRLVESLARKCSFMSEAIRRLGLSSATVVCARAEEWREGVGDNDVVLARAVDSQAVVLEYAAPLLRIGGTLVDWRGRRVGPEERAAERAAATLGMQRTDVRWSEPFADARDHHLHVFTKLHETPQRYPRRPGMARKRPLGG